MEVASTVSDPADVNEETALSSSHSNVVIVDFRWPF
jgi:hypothetical protein